MPTNSWRVNCSAPSNTVRSPTAFYVRQKLPVTWTSGDHFARWRAVTTS